MSVIISIHAPLTGSDQRHKFSNPEKNRFQSTLPLRGATRYGLRHKAAILISIHAPLTGSDLLLDFLWHTERHISIHAPLTGSDLLRQSQHSIVADFNPRSPYGERLLPAGYIVHCR